MVIFHSKMLVHQRVYETENIIHVPNHQPGLGVVDEDLTFNKRRGTSFGLYGRSSCDELYPLVMTNVANWKDPPFLMGKSTISMAIFNSYFDITRGYML